MPRASVPLRPEWLTIPQAQFRADYRRLRSLQDLAGFWRLSPSQLSYWAFRVEKGLKYTTFSVPRTNGKPRQIDAPHRTLKYLQRILHESLTRVYGPHPAVHGFVPRRSAVTNARNHLGRRYVLNIDMADFFPSITRQRIYGRFVKAPYLFQPKIANLISALSTNDYSQLPQGSPSSPIIANIIAAELDADLAKLCGRLRCRYTRYADDITISTSRNQMPPDIARYPNARGTGQTIIGDKLTRIIKRHGFQLNHRKSRLQSYWTRQMCTGLVVNGDRPSPPRMYIRHLRSLVDHWQKNGWREAAQVLHLKENRDLFNCREKLVDHINGKIGYLRMVRGSGDPLSQRLTQIINSMPQNH